MKREIIETKCVRASDPNANAASGGIEGGGAKRTDGSCGKLRLYARGNFIGAEEIERELLRIRLADPRKGSARSYFCVQGIVPNIECALCFVSTVDIPTSSFFYSPCNAQSSIVQSKKL